MVTGGVSVGGRRRWTGALPRKERCGPVKIMLAPWNLQQNAMARDVASR